MLVYFVDMLVYFVDTPISVWQNLVNLSTFVLPNFQQEIFLNSFALIDIYMLSVMHFHKGVFDPLID